MQIAALADAQHGVVSLAQLRRLGLSDTAVHKRAARGLLHRVHRAVYAVGRRGLSVDGRFAAAVMACGSGAVLSHRSVADRHGILGG
ncbi:MAG TPA: type IV toxin-antitoxin system AbiEi family antitoxin domain-containing protein, partial [Thermoleophilaceae bacterium]